MTGPDLPITPDTGATRSRRARLAALLETAQLPTPASLTDPVDDPPGAGIDHELVTKLVHRLQGLLADHDDRIIEQDRLEQELIRTVGYPRVRLPAGTAGRRGYAAALSAIVRSVPRGGDRLRLERRLLRKQRAWNSRAAEIGLAACQQDERDLDTSIRQTASKLFATPARSLRGVRIKLVVLIALNDVTPDLDPANPWSALRSILADLTRLETEEYACRE